jgi:hypothetical protein
MGASARFKSLLIHTCTIQVKTAGANDARNRPAYTWADSATGVDCRYDMRSAMPGNEAVGENQSALVVDPMLFMEVRTLNEADYRITNIVRKSDSVVLEAGPLNIRLVKNAGGFIPHHLEVHVQKGTAANVD